MTITEDRRPAAGGGADGGLTIELSPYADEVSRALVRRHGRVVFSCLVTRQPPVWLVTECRPQRRGGEPAALLLAVCDYLSADLGADHIVTISPAFWTEELAAAGAALLQRIIPMWLPLDPDLLRMHSRPTPAGWRVTPLDPAVDDPATLAGLSTDQDRDGDLRVWRETFAGDCGPIIPTATVRIEDGPTLRAAIAITEYLGEPLVSHLVAAAAERGTGLGRAVLLAGLSGLCGSGYLDCRLNVVEDNWTAHRLYRSVGFVQSGPTLQACHLDRTGADGGR